MQAPKYYWKVVRNPATNTATAFIGMNNPYISAAQAQADVFCADISSSITWLTWYPQDLVRGYSFACDLDGFRRVVTDLPAFTTVGVLR